MALGAVLLVFLPSLLSFHHAPPLGPLLALVIPSYHADGGITFRRVSCVRAIVCFRWVSFFLFSRPPIFLFILLPSLFHRPLQSLFLSIALSFAISQVGQRQSCNLCWGCLKSHLRR
jgi:hypothetical protein